MKKATKFNENIKKTNPLQNYVYSSLSLSDQLDLWPIFLAANDYDARNPGHQFKSLKCSVSWTAILFNE